MAIERTSVFEDLSSELKEQIIREIPQKWGPVFIELARNLNYHSAWDSELGPDALLNLALNLDSMGDDGNEEFLARVAFIASLTDSQTAKIFVPGIDL